VSTSCAEERFLRLPVAFSGMSNLARIRSILDKPAGVVESA